MRPLNFSRSMKTQKDNTKGRINALSKPKWQQELRAIKAGKANADKHKRIKDNEIPQR